MPDNNKNKDHDKYEYKCKNKVNIHTSKKCGGFYITFLWTILYAWQEEIYMININTNKCVKNYWVCFQVLSFFPDKYAETAAFEKI